MSACFIVGTLILSDDGKEEIEDVQVGDYVYARDQYGEEQAYKEVTEVFVRENSTLIHLVIGGETFTTTEEHPSYIEGEGFVEARALEIGDLVETADGEGVPIESVEVEYLEQPVTVYNFEVEDYHTYYVGDTEVLVHNTCSVGGIDTKGVSNSELHHIATDKSKKFDFKSHPAFKETGINVSKDVDNLVELAKHRGRHTYKYHQEVQDRLDAVVERYGGTEKLESAVRHELNKMKQELLDGQLDPYKK